MTFKNKWESPDSLIDFPESDIQKMIAIAFPKDNILSYQQLSGGLANVNVEFQLENHPSMILRIYKRDQNASIREASIARQRHDIPIPKTLQQHSLHGQNFAIVEKIPGISLKQLLLSKESFELYPLMEQVGKHLLAIGKLKQPIEGLSIPAQDLLNYASRSLNNFTVLKIIEKSFLFELRQLFDLAQSLLPSPDEASLVHGDFDPSNIFMNQINETWQVSGILDWEFAFIGSPLWDIANMLRYAHQMPLDFEQGFISALKPLPPNSLYTVHLLNIISLLDCLARTKAASSPNKCQDIKALIHYHSKALLTYFAV